MKRAPTAPALTLSAEEISIVLAYRSMDQRHKTQNMRTMTQDAGKYPERVRPALRLVSGGAS